MEKSRRIVKEHDERKNEIIDTAARLFVQKGYDKCSVNDILQSIGIAKGTFYHYFKSKEEVIDAVNNKATNLIKERIAEVDKMKDLSPIDRLIHVFLAMRIEDQMAEGLLTEIHRPENALLHQKSLVSTVDAVTPVLTRIVEEGNKAGTFHCTSPKHYMKIFLTAMITLTDDGIFNVPEEEQEAQFLSLLELLELMLQVEQGSITNRMTEYGNI